MDSDAKYESKRIMPVFHPKSSTEQVDQLLENSNNGIDTKSIIYTNYAVSKIQHIDTKNKFYTEAVTNTQQQNGRTRGKFGQMHLED